ncbi:hypothetical protein FB471_1627 [Amycolatopsis cihanbeyliensis]|uniref:Uncharacterized protein n=1 Tax=Amycolatopsis cihanbeyliensis TaxID=1128664 RepID=A0A542DFU6_AMYCI|nr:hypothetical protein FB471_1627 [Amycolatopsis cihanbeyliensis]
MLEAGAEWWLVVGVAADGPMPSARRFWVDYVDESGQRYRARTGKSVIIRPKCVGADDKWPDGW